MAYVCWKLEDGETRERVLSTIFDNTLIVESKLSITGFLRRHESLGNLLLLSLFLSVFCFLFFYDVKFMTCTTCLSDSLSN